MKKLVVLLLFVALVVVFLGVRSRLSARADPPKPLNFGVNTSYDLSNIPADVANNLVRNITKMNACNGTSCSGGSLVLRVDPGSMGRSQDIFNKILADAKQYNVTVTLQTLGKPDPVAISNFLNTGINSSGIRTVGLVIENEVNSTADTNFGGTPRDYLYYANSVLLTVNNSQNGSKIVGMLSNTNISNPGVNAITTANFFKAMKDADPVAFDSLMKNIKGWAESAYPIPPANCKQPCSFDAGVLSYKTSFDILSSLGYNLYANPNMKVYVIETGLQNDPNWAQYGKTQLDFIKKFLGTWQSDPRIIAVNFFNGMGINPDPRWAFFPIGDPSGNFSQELLALLNSVASGLVYVTPEGTVLPTKDAQECLDENGKLIGYVLNQDACKILLNIPKAVIKNPAEQCTASGIAPSVFRPKPCQNCERELPPSLLSAGAVTTTTISKQFQISRGKWLASRVNLPGCGGRSFIKVDWEGDFQVNTDNAVVPFAGWGNSDSLEKDAAVINYLADYYDGVALYDGKFPTLSTTTPALTSGDTISCDTNNHSLCKNELKDDNASCSNNVCVDAAGTPVFVGKQCVDDSNCDSNQFCNKFLAPNRCANKTQLSLDPTTSLDYQNKAGVFRKIAPMALQDDLRRKFISRTGSQKGYLPPGNYDVKLDNIPQVVVDGNNTTAKLSYKATVLDYFSDPRRIKPDPKNETRYPATPEGKAKFLQDLADWENLTGPKGEAKFWSTLWGAIPIAGREDAPGELSLSIQTAPGEITKKDGSPANFRVAFPHLDRLYEITNLLQQFFLNVTQNKQGSFLNSPDLASNDVPAKSNELSTLASVQPASTGEVLGTVDSDCTAIADFKPEVSKNSDGTYRACWKISGGDTRAEAGQQVEGASGCDLGYKVNITVDGKTYTRGPAIGGVGTCLYKGNQQRTSYDCTNVGAGGPVTFSGNANVSYSFSMTASNIGGDKCRKSMYDQNMECKIVDGQVDPICVPVPPLPPKPRPPVCGNDFFFTPSEVGDSYAVTDEGNKGKLDIICTNPNPITAKVVVKDDLIEIPNEPVFDEDGYFSVSTSRKIGVAVQIPYLNQIWDQVQFITKSVSPKVSQDLLNNDLQAKTDISYGFSDGGVSPKDGTLYYPHLGGLQCAKIYTIKQTIPEDIFTGTSMDRFYNAECKDFH